MANRQPIQKVEKPRWLRDLLRFLPLKPQFVLSGNVKDLQLTEVSGTLIPLSLTQVLASELRTAGFEQVICYDPVTGFRAVGRPGEKVEAGLLREVGLQPANGVAPGGVELLGTTIQRFYERQGGPIALIVDFASRLVVRNENLTALEHQLFTRTLVLAQQARSRPHGPKALPFFNTIIWVVDKEGDLPDWLLFENPRIRHIPIAEPDPQIRGQLASTLLRGLSNYDDADPDTKEETKRAFVDSTEGMLLVDMTAILELSKSEGLAYSSIGDAVRRYKVGVTDDPWRKIDRTKITTADSFVKARVRGQDHAVTHMLDIVKRAVTGVGGPKRGGRPRGVAFLAGPTGVGKTELAKTITSLLFSDESAYIRFDMSEFSAEHSDQRLIGAPPGYVGYDVGGQLTNAIRERPFSLVLFDEIEKAHPRILDKFLQILDDGVLTSGRGDRVYFSEAFIVFTSNLGIYKYAQDGSRVENVSSNDPISTVQDKVKSEIENHFKIVLNRPEILNRLGDNIVVFDFIRPAVAVEIFNVMVRDVLEGIDREQGITVTLADRAQSALRDACLADLSNGGRGIRNKVETLLINPLAREIFDQNMQAGVTLEINEIQLGTAGKIRVQAKERR